MATQTLDTLVTFYTADLTDLASGTKRGAQMVDRFARQTAQSLKDMGAAWRRTGIMLTATITAPIVAGSIALVNLASDAEETRSKFNTVFRHVSKEAQAAAKVMQAEFFQSTLESEKLLASTGDLLIGLGFAGDSALDMSLSVQKLSADLASFQNLEGGATQASEALTKGLLGESDALKVLGILVTEELKKTQMLADKQAGLTFATEQQAKAFAVLQIALRQSTNSIGDLQRTQGSFANQLRQTKTALTNMGVELGTILLPIALKVVKAVQAATAWFAKLEPAILKNIVVFALVAAAVGPLLIVLGLVISAIGTLIGLGIGLVAWGATVAAALVVALPVLIALAAAVTAVWLALKDVIDLEAVFASFGTFLKKMIEDTRDSFRLLAMFIRGDLVTLGDNFDTFFSFVSKGIQLLVAGWQGLQLALTGGLALIALSFQKKAEGIATIIRLLLTAWEGLALTITGAATLIVTAMRNLMESFSAIATFLGKDGFGKILLREAGALDAAAASLEGKVGERVENINKLLSGIGSTGMGEDAAKGAAAAFGLVFDELTADIDKRVVTINGLLNSLGSAPEFMKLGLTPVVDFFSNLPGVIDAAKQSVLDFLFVVPEIEMPELPGVPGADGAGDAAEIAAIQAEDLALAPKMLEDFSTPFSEEGLKIKDIFKDVSGSMIDSFSSGFASVLQGTKSFGKMMKQVLGGAMNQLLTMFIKHTIEKLALSKVETVGNAVAAAKHPWLIPLFVGVALAAFSAALGGVGGSQYDQSGDGGAGGAGAAIPDVPIAAPSGVVGGQSDVLASMDDSLGNTGAQTIVVRVDDEQGSALMSWMVRRTRDGIGDNTDRLALSSEVPA